MCKFQEEKALSRIRTMHIFRKLAIQSPIIEGPRCIVQRLKKCLNIKFIRCLAVGTHEEAATSPNLQSPKIMYLSLW